MTSRKNVTFHVYTCAGQKTALAFPLSFPVSSILFLDNSLSVFPLVSAHFFRPAAVCTRADDTKIRRRFHVEPRRAPKRPEIILPEKETTRRQMSRCPAQIPDDKRRRNLIPSPPTLTSTPPFPLRRTSVVNGREYKLY